MRKIEEQMMEAIYNGTDFVKDNTSVITAQGVTFVRFHGNLIAKFTRENDSIEISLAGYPSKTTKSRLNAMGSEWGFNVFQKDGIQFLTDGDGTVRPIDENAWINPKTIMFEGA